jgi:hypothetical protein
MIPNVIQRDRVIGAMDKIDRTQVPPGRDSRKFFVSHNGKRYPPKYVISVAFRIATGKELDPGKFNDGAETNERLRKLGFSIGRYENVVGKESSAPARRLLPAIPHPERTPLKHNERCVECKRNIEALLTKLYGSLIRNPNMPIRATLDGLDNSSVSNTLRQIYTALQENRGFSLFVRREQLPRCDFFVPFPGFLIEFDES